MNDETTDEFQSQPSSRYAMIWALVLSSMISTPVVAAPTDISPSPITSTNAAQVKPNIMLLMDTSYSMGWTHMPDEIESQVGFGAIGYKAAQCNVLYYNPTQTYALPKDATGALFPTPSFNSARYDGFVARNNLFDLVVAPRLTTDLASEFQAYDDSTLRFSGDRDALQKAYYYVRSGGTPITAYNSPACLQADPVAERNNDVTFASNDGGTWHRVVVGGAEAANFAIWYTYYRTRILLIKSAASLAFTPLTDSFRVGFITVRPKDDPTTAGPINPAKYLPIDDFTPVQRGLWFDKLFTQRPAGSSPTREGLARVGRHYAGMHDGINEGMTGDPVQFSCQQNFTIMTTDGYWNAQEESTNVGGASSGFLGGPVDISGKALVGQRDGLLGAMTSNNPAPSPAADFNGTPRPIWDGTFDGLRTIRSKNEHFEYRTCGTYFNKTTSTLNVSTSQLQKREVQTRQVTTQPLQSTSQNLQSTTQMLKATSQLTRSTFQRLKSTRQVLQTSMQQIKTTAQRTASTVQNRQTTNQNLQTTRQRLQTTNQTNRIQTTRERTVWIPQASTYQNLQTTTQRLQSTAQQNQGTTQRLLSSSQKQYNYTTTDKRTAQTFINTSQRLGHTEQLLKSTYQMLRRTAQTTQSSSQMTQRTLQFQVSTLQNLLATSQTTIRTTQLNTCNALGENCVPTAVGSCNPGGGITCVTRTTGPTLVAYNGCTAAAAAPGNSYRATICDTVTQAAVPALNCAFDPAGPGNSYTTTTCPAPNMTGPTPILSCLNIAAAFNNSYTATTCTPIATGPTFVAGCTASGANSGNSFVATSCFPDNRGPTGVDTCNAQTGDNTNNYLTITCGTNNVPDTGVNGCTAPARDAASNWTTTTCTPVTTTDVPSAACTQSPATALNNWLQTDCRTVSTAEVGMQTCVDAPGTATDYIATVCRTVTTSNPSGTCAGITADGTNGWTTTSCSTDNRTYLLVPVGSCTDTPGASGNSWTTTTCTNTVFGPYDYNANSCFADFTSGPYRYQCISNDQVDVPVASCTPSGKTPANNYTLTTCRDNNSALTPVGSCSPILATNLNNYTATICPIVTTTDVGVATCVDNPTADIGNSYTTTTCRDNNATSVPVLTCSGSGPSAGNGYTNTTCATNNQLNVAVASCTVAAAAPGNSYTETRCPPEILFSGPTVVSSCSPDPATAGNLYHRTDCATIVDPTPVQSGTCVPDPPNGITCSTVTTPNVPVASCTDQTADAANGWTQIVCGDNNTDNVAVFSCTASGPNAGNSWTTTTCPAAITTGPDFVATCTVTPAMLSNNWTSIGCPAPIVSGPTGVSSCSFIPADNTNSYTTTNCGNNNVTAPAQTCAYDPPTGLNGYTTTTCAANNSIDEPVVACSAQTAASGNGWVEITCPSPIVTTNVPVASCVDAPIATAVNQYTTTVCGDNNVLNTPDGACTLQPADNTNGYTLRTCPVLVTGPAGDPACVAQTGDGSNTWKTITCTPNNTTDVPVLACNASGADGTNGYTNTTCRVATTTDVGVATCSTGSANNTNSYVTTSCRSNDTDQPSGTCSMSGPTGPNGYTTTTCPVIDSGNIGTDVCNTQTGDGGNSWITRTCPGTVVTGPTPTGSCANRIADSANSWTSTTCSSSLPVTTIETTCNASGPVAGNGYVTTTCTQIYGKQLTATIYSRVQEFDVSGNSTVLRTDNTTTVGPTPASACYDPGTEPALPADGPALWTSADSTAYPTCVPSGTGPSRWPCTMDVNTNGPRSVNSLADVAQYYYITDLRTSANEPRGPNYYRDDVPSVGSGDEDDKAAWQHMTTFSIALGVSGTLQYKDTYKSSHVATDDFEQIRTGPRNWPLWPDPALNYGANPNLYEEPRSIDDFWHAAVNGRGTYFSAGNPTSVIAGLAGALAGITSRLSSSTGAGTSNLEPVAGDNFVYLANYTTQKWTGDVQAHEINLSTGAVEVPIIWSAQAKLDAKTSAACDNRKIMVFRSGATNNLADFAWNTRACDGLGNPTGPALDTLTGGEKANFAAANVQLLSQWPTMTDGSGATPNQRSDAADANLVNYLRGQRGLEDFASGVANKLYRAREHVLGDVVDGQPVYVRAPFASYSDAGYADFKTTGPAATRVPMLYVAANDGMLHAFYAGINAADTQGGKEAWAIIPSPMLGKLYKLADANYKNVHEYFVDGTPSVSDVFDGTDWKTVLVGGYNDGGRGYYAIDVTDPATPKGLWEFNWSNTCYDAANTATFGADCHLGKTFGKPLISKLADGRWVVMVTSGYNNVNATPKTGDGLGYLYVLNAVTGKVIYKIPTTAGTYTTPSGLAQINNFVDKADIDNTTVRVYGTDVLGNIWRFDVNDNTDPSGREATLIGTAKDANGNPQPITIRAELTQVGGKPMLLVATGKLLGATDTTDVQRQSIYGIVDPVTATTAFTDLRASLAPLTMTQVGSGAGAYRVVRCNGSAATCGRTDGWYVDLPDNGERVNVEMKLRAQTLIIGSNVPQIGACVAGGYSWLNFLNFQSGLAINASPNLSTSVQISNALIVGLTVITIGGELKGILTLTSGVRTADIPHDPYIKTPRRISWREVMAQ